MELESAQIATMISVLGETTRTVIPLHYLRLGYAVAWADGPEYSNVIIETAPWNPMAFIFGEDADWQADTLVSLSLKRLYWCPDATVNTILPRLQGHFATEREFILTPDIQRTTATYTDFEAPDGSEIRRLTSSELAAVENAPEEIQWLRNGWTSWEQLLNEGIAIAAIEEGVMVSGAVTFARAARLDDIGVATATRHQRRGLSTACASRLVAAIIEQTRQPVWTVFECNTPSRRISDKLGFQTQTRCTVIRQQPE